MKENQNIEWKASRKDDYLKWLCGFANADGGSLIIGRNNAGEAVGVAHSEKLLEDLPNKIRDVLGIIANVRLFHEKGKDLIEIHVDPYPNPVSCKGEYHYRSGSTKQELKGAALDRFLLRKYGRTWDSVPVPKTSAQDLSAQAFALFRKLARQGQRLEPSLLLESDAVLLEKLNVVEPAYLKRAALLLFHPDPNRFFTGAFIKIGYFRSETDILYHDEIHGDLFTQVQKTIELLLFKYLKAVISYQGIQRIETYPVPVEALRETLLNAVIHRDYAAATPIQIRVYDNRLCIWNPGILPENWTVKKLLSPHSSHPYNPLIANAFFWAGEIEAWGRGVQQILKTCTDAGSPPPSIDYTPNEISVEFPFPADYLAALSSPAIQADTPRKPPEKLPKKPPRKFWIS